MEKNNKQKISQEILEGVNPYGSKVKIDINDTSSDPRLRKVISKRNYKGKLVRNHANFRNRLHYKEVYFGNDQYAYDRNGIRYFNNFRAQDLKTGQMYNYVIDKKSGDPLLLENKKLIKKNNTPKPTPKPVQNNTPKPAPKPVTYDPVFKTDQLRIEEIPTITSPEPLEIESEISPIEIKTPETTWTDRAYQYNQDLTSDEALRLIGAPSRWVKAAEHLDNGDNLNIFQKYRINKLKKHFNL